jgi:hypothetical protein
MGFANTMISISTNINVVIKAKLEQIQALQNNPDPVLRTVALAVLPELKHRVHVDGKDSAGNAIGTYSKGYMAVRTGNFTNAATFSRGAKKGKFKDKKKAGEAGTFTKGLDIKVFGSVVEDKSKVGLNRPVYNRTTDTKVILSLTRQMENDLSVVPSGNGYGIGYLNPDNFKKAMFCEANYGKKILSKLTKEEVQLAKSTAENFLPEYLKSFE